MNIWWYQHFPRLTFRARKLVGANYEREMQLLDALCDRAATGIDVGAKVGMYTYRIRERSSDVVAFEPIPLLNTYLRAAFGSARSRIEPYALSNKPGETVIRMPYDRSGSPVFGRSTIDASNKLDCDIVARVEELHIETRALDGYALPNVGFIKIDVEGHELAVLEGAEQTVAAQHPNLLIECNDEHQPGGVGKLAAWLASHDYDAFFLFGHELLPVGSYDRDTHWLGAGVENFIGVHRARPDVKARVHELAKQTTKKQRAV